MKAGTHVVPPSCIAAERGRGERRVSVYSVTIVTFASRVII